MKHRVFVAAVLACALTLSVHAQPTLPPILTTSVLLPPTAAPVLASATPEQAATNTPSATLTPASTVTLDPLVTIEPLNIEVTTDVLFPIGLGFRVLFIMPSTGLSSITMTLAQDGWEGQTIDVDLADVVSDENGFAMVQLLWTVGDNPPRLYEPVAVTWTVTPRGGAGELVEVETLFADSRVSWMVVQDGDVPVRIAMADSRTTGAVIAAQLELLAELLAEGGREIEPLNLALFPAGLGVNPCAAGSALIGPQTTVEAPCDIAAAQAVYDAQAWTVTSTSLVAPGRTILTDQIIRAVYPSLFSSQDVPEWFKTGLIAYFAGSFNISELEAARGESRNNSLLPSLDVIPAGDAVVAQWRAQSIGTVVYMASLVGVAPFLELLDRIDNGESLAEAWPALSGQAMEALNVSWRNWIFDPRAEIAYSVPPSLDPTLTLVPTRTATFTPTPTSTFTPSATLTNTIVPSSTPTLTPSLASGFVPPTAAPTALPSEMPPPTLTPRPPEAFSLSDAVAEAPSAQNSGLLIPVGIFLVAGAVLIVSLGWMRRNR